MNKQSGSPVYNVEIKSFELGHRVPSSQNQIHERQISLINPCSLISEVIRRQCLMVCHYTAGGEKVFSNLNNNVGAM